jgi:hypothetical protein
VYRGKADTFILTFTTEGITGTVELEGAEESLKFLIVTVPLDDVEEVTVTGIILSLIVDVVQRFCLLDKAGIITDFREGKVMNNIFDLGRSGILQRAVVPSH